MSHAIAPYLIVGFNPKHFYKQVWSIILQKTIRIELINKNNVIRFTVRIRKPWALEIYSGMCFCPLRTDNAETTLALLLEPIKVLSVIGQRTKEHS